MNIVTRQVRAGLLGLLLASSALAAGTAQAQTPFGEIDKTAAPSVRFTTPDGAPIIAGSEVAISGSDFRPGQTITLSYGATPLTPQPLTADAEGAISGNITLPADATVGVHPIVVVADAPYSATIAELKVSPDLPLSGQENFTITPASPARGLYQSAYSAKNNALFTASAVGRPPVTQSELTKLDADTLEVTARITPAPAPQREGRDGTMQDGGVFAVYGVAVDDAKDTVWATNTRQNSVAVYRQSDLGLVKQFAPGTVQHARDVRVDSQLGKAYASAGNTPEVVVFDTATNEETARIAIPSGKRGEEFAVMSLSLDPAAHRLYSVSLSSAEVAVIDTNSDAVLNVFDVPGAIGTIGVSHDPQTGRIFVAAQGSDNLVILDGATGDVVADTPIGAGALNVAFDPASRLAYVTSRNAGTVTVTDADGNVVANLGPAPLANHVALGPNGAVFVVDKSAGRSDAEADQLLRIQPKN